MPDIAGNADIASGYITLANGRWGPTGGTSAVAPLYAGLVALLNQALGHPVKDLLRTLYALPAADRAAVFQDITTGSNSIPKTDDFGPAVTGYDATAGWDACTGWGSIDGSRLRAALAPAPIIVTALGGAGEMVTRPDGIAPALRRAFASGVPYLVNVITDPAVAYPRATTGV